MLDNNLNYTTDEIAEKLCRLAEGCNRKPDEQTINETEYALFQIRTMAENPYNNECWSVLWKVLQNLTNYCINKGTPSQYYGLSKTKNNNINTDELTTIRARRKTYVNTEF